uniref:Uncharacterized protein n=1 Tax=Pristionchus pacificus TaxID=54126 RepID=A0A2A6BK73_PRIPA|eukprot:PDM66312.1 hypothetical protein PRIPAC_47729 [Pristionchus pacificus]
MFSLSTLEKMQKASERARMRAKKQNHTDAVLLQTCTVRGEIPIMLSPSAVHLQLKKCKRTLRVERATITKDAAE